MDIRRRACSRRVLLSRSFTTVFLVVVAIPVLVVAATGARAHPTVRELREAFAERARCEAVVAEEERIDPVRLGMSERELLAVLPGLRRVPSREGAEPALQEQADPRGWTRAGTEDLAGAEYELWQGRVYRIRWRLPAEFERPVIDELGRRARLCFGPPEYDQTFEARPGSSKATLRRIRWKHGDRQIELRQLHPLRGGPVYLSVALLGPLREIGAAGRAVPADPDRSGPWWRRPAQPLVPATDAERDRLGRAFVRFLAQLDH